MAAPQLEGTEKYTVSTDFSKSLHGSLGCIACHKGNNDSDIKTAHQGMIKDPSDPSKSGGICANCHIKQSQLAKNSLHNNLNGFRASLTAFSGKDINEVLKDKNHGLSVAFNGNCNNCHASCGQCHVSRPTSQKGGLLSMHKFEKNPPMDKTCYGCHGARNAGEFMGIEGNPDVHYTKKNPKTGKNFECVDCHKESSFHGSGTNEAKNMHEVTGAPNCIDCHAEVVSGSSKVKMHNAHAKDTLSCQVCHSTQNNNCSNCHVSVSKEGKLSSNSHLEQKFKIGLNPNVTELHPEKYVVLRHIPTTADSFKELGENLLPNYNKIPNWKVSPSHNIQRYTPQNGNCNNCHGNKEIFLTKDDLLPNDSKANEKLLVNKIPAKK